MAVGQRCQHILAEWKKPKATCPKGTAATASPLAHRAREDWQIARIRCPRRQRFEMRWETGERLQVCAGSSQTLPGPHIHPKQPGSHLASLPLSETHLFSGERDPERLQT